MQNYMYAFQDNLELKLKSGKVIWIGIQSVFDGPHLKAPRDESFPALFTWGERHCNSNCNVLETEKKP